MWDDLAESTQAEKLEFADKMAGVNQKNAGNGDAAVFTGDEIREAAGYENNAKTKRAREEEMADVEPDPIPAPGAATADQLAGSA